MVCLRCLMDSQLQGAHSQFLPRTQDNKLRLVIDAFRFHQEEQGEVRCQTFIMLI